MNLERSSAQIVHSSGNFRAVFFVEFVQFSSFGWIFWVNLGSKKNIADNLTSRSRIHFVMHCKRLQPSAVLLRLNRSQITTSRAR